jgi:hypothetical protein
VGKLVALYGRFSTEHQNAKSAADQLADCRAYAGRQGYTVVGEYEDAAKSSASLHNRPGLRELRAAVKGGQISAVIVEATNRLSRSQADIGQLFREFEFYGTELETPTGGKVDKVRAGLDGLTGEMQLDAQPLAAAGGRGTRSMAAERGRTAYSKISNMSAASSTIRVASCAIRIRASASTGLTRRTNGRPSRTRRCGSSPTSCGRRSRRGLCGGRGKKGSQSFVDRTFCLASCAAALVGAP